MSSRRYYSVRTGVNPADQLDLTMLRQLFVSRYDALEGGGLFQEWLGFSCVDDPFIPGACGSDVQSYVLLKVRKDDIWPIHSKRAATYTEDDIFDLVEFLHDHASKGIDGRYHDYNCCGWHYSAFDAPAGRAEFRASMNELLADYGDGYELSEDGEILTLPDSRLASLLAAPLPALDSANVESRIEQAVRKFRRRSSTLDERADAIRDLAAVLEFLRPQLKDILETQDETDLFNLANNFGIRHHNPKQKTRYDRAIWYSWMFYYYLTTLHAAMRLIAKRY